MNAYGYQIEKNWFGSRIYHLTKSLDINKPHRYPFADVWYYNKTKEYSYLSNNYAKKKYSKNYFLNDDVANRSLFKFGNYYLYGPANPENYLT